MNCKRCYSYAINHHCHGRDGSGEDLCDVCYWRNIAEKHNNNSFQGQLLEARKRIIELENEVNMKHTHHAIGKLKNELNQANDRIKMLIAAGDMMEPYATQQTAELWAKAKENK